VAAVEPGLVLDLPPDLAKVAVRDGLGHLVILQHAAHVQVLNGYQGVVFAQVAGELVGSITADTGDTRMLLCQLPTGLLAVLAALLAPGLLFLIPDLPLLDSKTGRATDNNDVVTNLCVSYFFLL